MQTTAADKSTQAGWPAYGAYTINPKRHRRTKGAIASIRGTIKAILEESHPQTCRQIFYAATVRGAIAKVEAEYQKTIIRLLVELREKGEVPFEWISDNTRWMRKPSTFTGIESCLNSTASFYRRDLWAAMPVYVEVWCEKDALAGVLVEETATYDVPLMVARGYSSITFLHSAAMAIKAKGTLTWSGRIVVVAACTTAWDQAHAVITAMGDRFVLVRSDSGKNASRLGAGKNAIRNTGVETTMRKELAEAVAGLVHHVDPNQSYDITEEEVDRVLGAADIVTLARTGVETDYRGDIIDAHAPEMPTRFAKQLTQIMRGALAIGMTRPEAMALIIRCARNSMPPLRLAILEDIGENPDSRIIDVRRRLQRPRATADRALQALHVLGLLVCREEEEQRNDGPRYIRHYSLAPATHLGALCVPDLSD